MPDTEQQNNNHHSAGEELRHLILERGKRLWHWFKPNPEDPVAQRVLLMILKIPLMLLVILLSPIAAIVLLLTFMFAF